MINGIAMKTITDHQLEAYNTSKDSDNKIHDDAVAKKFGFAGGLVPGVDVYAYLTNPVVKTWGHDWLNGGSCDCRLIKPVYDGATVTVKAEFMEGKQRSMKISVESMGQLCAEATANLPSKEPKQPNLDRFLKTPLPKERPPASSESLPVGALLGSYSMPVSSQFASEYLENVRETLPIYRNKNLVHPGIILRFGNWALNQNVLLGPWIHVASNIQNLSEVKVGEELSVRSLVINNYERKGHKFVELDAVVLAGDDRFVARIEHRAIYQPRQVLETH